MTDTVPAALDTGVLASAVAAALIGASIVAYLLLSQEFEASAPQSASGDGDDVVCARCHHRTDPTAGTCPECGKEL